MSLRGRYVIDRLKRSLSPYIGLPVPPYGDPSYWEGCYRSLGPTDVYEWGNVAFKDLAAYDYTLQDYDPLVHTSTAAAQQAVPGPKSSTDFAETLKVFPKAATDEPIVVLGCGNSKFGEDMFEEGWRGPLIQVDVASRAVESLSQRCGDLQVTGDMQFVQDDATVLSAFQDETVAAVFDKGLIDALFCADEYQQVYNVMESVQRVLQPGRIFTVLSFSRPEFIMDRLLLPDATASKSRKLARTMWGDIQVRKLDFIFLYRFQKAEKASGVRSGGGRRGSSAPSSRKGRQRR